MKKPSASRRHFILTTLAAGSVAALASKAQALTEAAASTSSPTELPSLAGRKVLVVRGGYEPHEPVQCTDLFIPWMRAEGAKVHVFDSLEAYADKSLMGAQDLILQSWTMGTLGKEQEEGLLNAVRNGCSLAGWHGGLCDSFRANTGYWYMTGGQWVAHPGGAIDYTVDITDPEDPVTRGLTSFAMHSEQYYLLIDPNSKVLATTTFSGAHDAWIKGCVIPVAWKKSFGKGRVFYSSVAHNSKDFRVPQVLELMKRGIRWASASKHAPAEPCVRPAYPGAST
ncbi:MAG: ThuA domain-containing protein [Opitutaceae bacterium]|jgi:hypothetical protein